MFEVGTRVDRYEIVAPLRSGGMADLFLARHEGPGGFERIVALKVIHPRFAKDRNFVDMFLDEARLAARIDHPNVVHIENLGEHDGTYYMVMEYLHGASLGELLTALSGSTRRLSPATAVSLAIDLAAGLHAAHELRGEDGKRMGVVHRDVSPQNGLLTTHGEVKLIDFGIAKARGRLHVTQAQNVKGKVAYMPPEQLMGAAIDRRTDVYALGVVLWELLTQARLFHAAREVDLIPLVRAGAKRAPSELVSEISPELDRAVMAALASNPDDRPATAREFRNSLREACPDADRIDPPDRAGLLLALLGGQLATRAVNFGAGAMSTAFGTIELSTEPLRCLERLTLRVDSRVPPRTSAAPTAAASPGAIAVVEAPSPVPEGESRTVVPGRRIGLPIALATLALGAALAFSLLYFLRSPSASAFGSLPGPSSADAASGNAPLIAPPQPIQPVPLSDASVDARIDSGKYPDASMPVPAPAAGGSAPRPRPAPTFETFDDF